MNTEELTFEKLIAVQRITRAYRHTFKQKGPAADVSRGQGRVLSLLKLRDGLATKEMAEILGIRVSSLNETLGRMERDGIIDRRPSEQDKRVMLMYLTENGAALDSPRAKLAPTRSGPMRPGPVVYAIASISLSSIPASFTAASAMGAIFCRWARAAISGTTPPYRACSSIWL